MTAIKPAISGDSWFTVDRAGLAQLLTRKHGKLHAIVELVSNAWDQNVTTVSVTLERAGGNYVLVVEDDDPAGFADLTHAYTVFAPSTKKGDALKRGRFNLGEKLVLALCSEAEIATTKGTVRFTPDGRRVVDPARRKTGSEFRGAIDMTRVEAREALDGLQTLIPPAGIRTLVNGLLLAEREPLMTLRAPLDTEIAGEDGNLRRTTRVGEVALYRPLEGEVATIYEMGIPVVSSTGYYHVNVMQKVPLNMDRDNVTPRYAKALHVYVMNAAYDQLPAEQFKTAWAKSALSDDRIIPEAVRASVKGRFGDKVVAFDPHDPEANRLAAAQGYVVVHGGALSGAEWEQAKGAGAIRPAGQVTPSPKVEMEASGAPDLTNWSPGMHRMAQHSSDFAGYAGVGPIKVAFVDAPKAKFLAACGPGSLTYNRALLGAEWFDHIGAAQDALLLHELGHVRIGGAEGGHLHADYPDEIARLGALLARYYMGQPAEADLVVDAVLA